jgi:hypothetical protein
MVRKAVLLAFLFGCAQHGKRSIEYPHVFTNEVRPMNVTNNVPQAGRAT